MKRLVWLLLLLVSACREKESLSITPAQLIGTWNTRSTIGERYTRWTFDREYLYMVTDTLKVCQPAKSQPWQYRLEDKILVARYAGFTTGLIPIPDIRLAIVSLNPNELVLSNKYRVLDKCP